MSLITTIDQFRLASSINVSNTIANWQPYLDDAEEMFIIPSIGKQAFELARDFESADDGTHGAIPQGDSEKSTLQKKVLKAAALYALYLGIDEISISISSAGIQVIQSDTHKPAPQYQIMNVKETFLTRAHRQIDSILDYIRENSVLLEIELPLETAFFIQNAASFQRFSDIHGSRRVFLALEPVMKSIEERYIKPTLSADYFDALKASISSGDEISDDDQVIIDMVQPAIAHLTMARALLEISIDTLDWGIFNNSANTFVNVQNKAQIVQSRVSSMHDANQRDGEAELKMLQEFLDNSASASKYPLYFASSRFVGKENALKRGEFINSVDSSIFVA